MVYNLHTVVKRLIGLYVYIYKLHISFYYIQNSIRSPAGHYVYVFYTYTSFYFIYIILKVNCSVYPTCILHTNITMKG